MPRPFDRLAGNGLRFRMNAFRLHRLPVNGLKTKQWEQGTNLASCMVPGILLGSTGRNSETNLAEIYLWPKALQAALLCDESALNHSDCMQLLSCLS